MKKQILFCLMGLVAVMVQQQSVAQSIKMEPGKRTEKLYTLKASVYEVDSVNVTLTFDYDMDSNILRVVLKPQRMSYDFLWLPMKAYEPDAVKQYVKRELRSAFRTHLAFRNQSIFGIKPVWECLNCELLGSNHQSGTGNQTKEWVSFRDSAVYRFSVYKPQNSVKLTLKGVVPISRGETWTGKTKYRYMFISDAIKMELSVPIDPCRLTQSKVLRDSVDALYKRMNDDYSLLAESNGKHQWKICQECKDRFEKGYSEPYNQYLSTYEMMGKKCPAIGVKLDAIRDIFNDAEKVKCKKPETTGGTTKRTGGEVKVTDHGAAQKIKDYTLELDRCINAIRAGRNSSEARLKARNLIKQTDEYINGLGKELSDKKVQDAIEAYRYQKSSFELIEKRN